MFREAENWYAINTKRLCLLNGLHNLKLELFWLASENVSSKRTRTYYTQNNDCIVYESNFRYKIYVQTQQPQPQHKYQICIFTITSFSMSKKLNWRRRHVHVRNDNIACIASYWKNRSTRFFYHCFGGAKFKLIFYRTAHNLLAILHTNLLIFMFLFFVATSEVCIENFG